MAYPVAILIFHLPEYETFRCFSNLILNNKFLKNLYTFKTEMVEIYS